MKWWMRERDQLIEQTLAFVEGVAAARPARTEPAKQPEPVKKPEPAKKAEPAVAPPKPMGPPSLASERAEIERRVANFKANQQKFQRAREAHYDAIFSKARATPGNPPRP